MKNTGVAYILLILGGFVGMHKFYVGKAGMGIIYMLTFGVLGIGILVDLFTLDAQVRECNQSIKESINDDDKV